MMALKNIWTNIIEDIFNKIILEKFSQEYNEVIKYGGINNNKTNDNYYQNLLFNSSDLMTQIFQYLNWGIKFDDDLYSCSLVSSRWLYHVWNANSVYYIDFSKLVDEYNLDNSRKWTRIWQRLYNVKFVKMYLNLEDSKAAALATVNQVSIFRKVEKVVVLVDGEDDDCFSAVMPIMSRCRDMIKYCRIEICNDGFDSSDFEAPSPLRLPKVQCVEIGVDLVFYHLVWTNECTKLKLFEVVDFSKDWCKFVIENCDCTNITSLILDDVTFDDNSINEVILKQLALKFCNLQILKMNIYEKVDNNVILFWQLLKPIISTNKTKVQLEVDDLEDDEAILLSERMDEKDLKIDKLIIRSITMSRGHDWSHDVHGTTKLIQERDNRGLHHLSIERHISQHVGNKLLDVLKCKSITTFELNGHNIDFINALLEWKMIEKQRVFVITDVYYYDSSDRGLSLLKQLYENVYRLFVQQIAIDIKIKCESLQDSKLLDSYLSLYLSYFENEKFLSKYNEPKCNSNLCLPRDKPYTHFYIHDSKKEKYFVFGASNVQMK